MDKPCARIVVPLDGTARARSVLPAATEIARRIGVPITLLSVIDDYADYRVTDDFDEIAESYAPDLVIEPLVLHADTGGVAITIVHEAAGDGALLCMASRTRRAIGQVMLGSVTEEALRLTAKPVLVAGPNVDPSRSVAGGPVVACLDGSQFAESMLPAASAWSMTLDVPLHLVVVVGPDAIAEQERVISAADLENGHLQDLADRLPGDVPWEVLRGDNPSREIADHAQRLPAGLLAVATHVRTGWRRVSLGSVAMRIVHRAPCPVIVVRSRSLET